MSRNLHMFPHNVPVAEAKNVPLPRTRELLSPPHPSASTTRTMTCSAFFSQIKTDRGTMSPAPPTIPSLDANPDIYMGAGSELGSRDVVTRGLMVYTASSAHFAPSALSCRQDTLSSVPTDVSHAATRAWNSSTSHISPTSVLASSSTIEAGPSFSPSLHPLYPMDFRKKSLYTSHGITNRREPAIPAAFGFPIPVPPSWWVTVYPVLPSPASTLLPSHTSSHISLSSKSPSDPSCNMPRTSNNPSSTTSSVTFAPNSASPVSSSTTSLISTPPLPSQSRTTSVSSFSTISQSSTRRYHSETTTSTIGAGVLSTNNPKGPDGFARNTTAIVAVAVACTVSIIMAVFAIFFACKRYKGRGTLGASSPSVLDSTPWHPPLAGDDDNQYFTDQHGGLVTASSRQHLESDTHSDEMTTYTGIERLGPVRSVTHGAGSSESGVSQPMRNMSFGQQSSVSYAQAADIAFPLPSTGYIPSAPLPTAWLERSADIPDACIPQHREASDGAPSLHAAASSHGHFAASSSGHGMLSAEALSPGPSSFKDFIGRLRPGRSSLPNIVVHGSSSKSSSRDSVTSNNTPPPPTPFTARPTKPTLGSPLPSYPWASDSLPPLPSPTATENSRMFEDLLTPHLGVQRTSSEHSSLRDNVDYSRPISGLVRNRVHSTVTFQTGDTAAVILDGSI